MSTILNKETILAANDRPLHRETVAEWGGDVFLAVMTGADRDAWEVESVRDSQSGDYKPNWRARYLSRCLVDADRQPLFSVDDIAKLGTKNSRVLDRLFDVAAKINGVDSAATEDRVKNSESDQSDDSGSV